MSEQKKLTREFWSKKVEAYYNTYMTMPSAKEALDIITDWVEQVTPLRGAILDLGCGPGYLAQELTEMKQNFTVTGVDISEEMIAHAESLKIPNAVFHVADAETFQSEWFYHTAIAKGLFEYLEEDEKLFMNVHRMLKPSGHLIAAFRHAGFTHGDPNYIDPYPMKRRTHDPMWVSKLAEDLGFEHIDTKFYHYHKGLDVPEAASAFVVLFKKIS